MITPETAPDSGPDTGPDTVPVRRTHEIEDATNLWVVHPISNRLVPVCARLGVTPNAVSVAGMAFGILAGVAYYFGLAVPGFVLMIAWHVMDGVDGQLARLTHTHSEFGKVLDGICDYVTFAAVYVGLALTLDRQYGGWVWGLVAVAGAFHAVQSAIYEVQRQNYNFLGRGQASAEFVEPAERARAHLPAGGRAWHRRGADRLLQGYVRVQRLALGPDAEARRRVRAILAVQPERAAPVREAYRDVFAPALRRWSVLSANYRTLAIFAFAALGRPIWYFWFEIFGFSAVLVALLAWQRTRYAVFFRSLPRAS